MLYLVLIIDQEEYFGIVLIHNRQKQSLKNWTLQNGGSYLTSLPKDGVKDIQKARFGFLKEKVLCLVCLRRTKELGFYP